MATKQHNAITGADLHDPKAHATSHESGGSDAITIVGVCPIGSVVGWLKTTTNVPTLAAQGRTEWEELNGQTISDAESPMDGQTLPDGIGTNDDTRRFLRFNSTSGGTGGSCNHYHCVNHSCNCAYGCGGSQAVCCVCATTDTQTHLPPYLDMVPIVRVK